MMRRTLITLGLLLPVAACADGGMFGDDSRQSSTRSGTTTSSATMTPTVPPQAGQPGQTSQQARSNVAQQPGGAQALSGTTGMASSSGMMQLSAAEQSFVMSAAQGGMAEVELGRLAESRGASAQVRDFGRMMVQQHTQANSELMAIAQRMGLTPPTALPAPAQAAQMRLQAAQGQDFDRQYIEQQAAAHLEQRTLFQFAANNAQNPELRSFAQKTLPVLERHIDQLKTIAPTARTGS